MLKFQKFQKKQHNLEFFLVIFILAIVIQINLIIAPFDKNDPATWKEDLSKYGSMTLDEIKTAWQKLDNLPVEQKQKIKSEFFNSLYKKLNGRDIKLEGIASDDIKFLDKNTLVVQNKQNKDKRVYIPLSLRESVVGLKYDEKEQTVTYEFKGGKKSITLDEGYINKDGKFTVPGKTNILGALGRAFTPGSTDFSVDLMYGDGRIEYKNGEFKLYGDAALKIGKDFYSAQDKTSYGSVRIDSKNEFVLGRNIVAEITSESTGVDGKKTDVVSARVSTGTSTSEDAYVAIFTSGLGSSYKGTEKYNPKGVYVDVALASGTIAMDDKGTKQYSQVEIFRDFNSIKGDGEQMWIKNGDALISFWNSGVGRRDGTLAGPYEVTEVKNLKSNPYDANKEEKSFTWARYGNNPNADFFDKKVRFSDTIANPTIDVLGHASSSPVVVHYNKEYEQGYFKGSEEDRIKAIAKDPNTIVTMRFASSVPGQYVDTEIVRTLDSIYKAPASKDTSIDMLKAYNPSLDLRGLTREQIDALPPYNRLVYELATTYSGSIEFGTPRQTKKNEGPFISGGLYQIDWRKDGAVVSSDSGSAFIEGFGGKYADYYTWGMASRLLSYKNNPEAYPELGKNFESVGFYLDRRGLIPMIRAGLAAYSYGVNRNQGKKEEVDELRNQGKIP